MPKHSKKHASLRTESQLLTGWQQIAAFLGHSAAVVQRWASEGIPVHRQGRYVATTADELNTWLGKQSGKPVSVATENTDLASELKRGLAFRKEGKRREGNEEDEPLMKKPVIRVTKWLSDIPVEASCSACPQVSFRAQGSSQRPNREEYRRSLLQQFDAHCEREHAKQA